MSSAPNRETARPVAAGTSRRSLRTLARNDQTMSHILHRPAPDAIGETPDAHSENSDPKQPADTLRHWSDTIWYELPVNNAVMSRMARLDRALQAMGTLQQMLMRDHRGVSDVEMDPETYFHEALTQAEVQGMHLAFDMIWEAAYDDMADLRDNKQDCWGKGGRA